MRKMVIVLTVVMVLAGLVLAASYAVFQPQIQKNQAKALQQSLVSLFQGRKDLTFTKLKTDKLDIYAAKDSKGALVGYAVRVVGSGYGGPIQMLVGVDSSLKKIVGLQVVENVETPGLGSRIADNSFRNQFKGLDPGKVINYVKNATPDPAKNQIEALSGSTISSRAVTTALTSTLAAALPAIVKAAGAK